MIRKKSKEELKAELVDINEYISRLDAEIITVKSVIENLKLLKVDVPTFVTNSSVKCPVSLYDLTHIFNQSIHALELKLEILNDELSHSLARRQWNELGIQELEKNQKKE